MLDIMKKPNIKKVTDKFIQPRKESNNKDLEKAEDLLKEAGDLLSELEKMLDIYEKATTKSATKPRGNFTEKEIDLFMHTSLERIKGK